MPNDDFEANGAGQELTLLILAPNSWSKELTRSTSSQAGRGATHKPKRLFIGYSHRDSLFAKRLAADLHSVGLDVWIDLWQLRPGDELIRQIGAGLQTADFFLPILSPAFVMSTFARRELDEILVRQLRTKKVKVVPIYLKRCRIPSLIQSVIYADFRSSYSLGLESVSKSLGVAAPIYPVICLNETAVCRIFDRGRKFKISHATLTELSQPAGDEFVELNVYHASPPRNVRVTSGRVRVESVMGLHRLVTRLLRTLPVHRPFKRTVSYEMKGEHFDTEDRSWFIRLQTNFEWMKVILKFSPDCTHPQRISAVLDRDGFLGPKVKSRQFRRNGWLTFVIELTSEMAQWRTLQVRWD